MTSAEPASAALAEAAEPKQIEMHVHSFGMRFHFTRLAGFDVFRYIDMAAAEGFTGVNVSANGPGYRDLGGTTPEHFERVRAHAEERRMRLELDTSDTRADNMRTMLGVAEACGADTLRVYTKYSGTLRELIDWSVRDLRDAADIAAARGVLIVIENHEEFQGDALAEIVGRIDSPWVRALYDYGNSQMVGEDPLVALHAMGPHVSRVHLKDHVIVADPRPRAPSTLAVQGVAVGDGLLPIIEQTLRLYDLGVRRFCFENVWGYTAPVRAAALPATPPFAMNHGHQFLDATALPAQQSIAGEAAAFRRGWDWLRGELTAAGFVIAR